MLVILVTFGSQHRVGSDNVPYGGRIETATTWHLSLAPRGAGGTVGRDRQRGRGRGGGVDGDSEVPAEVLGGGRSKTTKSPRCRPVSSLALVRVGRLLVVRHTKLAGV